MQGRYRDPLCGDVTGNARVAGNSNYGTSTISISLSKSCMYQQIHLPLAKVSHREEAVKRDAVVSVCWGELEHEVRKTREK